LSKLKLDNQDCGVGGKVSDSNSYPSFQNFPTQTPTFPKFATATPTPQHKVNEVWLTTIL